MRAIPLSYAAAPGEIRGERALLAIFLIALTASAISAPWTGWAFADFAPTVAHGAATLALWPLMALLLASAHRRRPRPLVRTARAWWRHVGGTSRLARVAATLMLMSAIVGVVSGWKRRLGHQAPFRADPIWHHLDVAMHGGRLPSAWLAPLLDSPRLVAMLELWYYPGCYVVTLVAVGALLWAPPGAVRTRILVTTALTWLMLGAVAASVGASAGPLFYGLVVDGPDPYAWQVAQIARVPTGLAWRAREFLWSSQSPSGVPSSGAAAISAFPSMHVATMASYLLLARAFGHRRVVGLAWAALAATLLGSIALGLHYAIDGYASLLGVVAIWWGVGRVQQWRTSPTGTT